jgi:antitoxin VapB
MSTTARRRQPPITIRSARAVARLALLTRDGRSQAQVIEEALDRMPLPQTAGDLAPWRADVERLLSQVDHDRVPSMAAFDAAEYDENGQPR